MNPATTLYRQVHPDFIPGGQLSSQAFMPFLRDEGKLSVYDGDQISASESCKHYTEILLLKTAGVWGITCAEATAVGLTSAPGPLAGFPSHAVIDFTAQPEKSLGSLPRN